MHQIPNSNADRTGNIRSLPSALGQPGPLGQADQLPRASQDMQQSERRRRLPVADIPNNYAGPTYYGQPTVKPSSYGALVWGYTYVAGIAGSAQVLAGLASRRPRWQGMARRGRLLALLGPTLGAALLVIDLHTPRRWYNMLRIFRKTSPMSIGTYILSSFGVTSGLTAAGDVFGNTYGLRWLRPVARIAQAPAALAGAGMSTYTGALLSATSSPAWAATPRLLTARFACSAMATAAAALSLGEQIWGEERNAHALDKLALTATVADAALAMAQKRALHAAGVTETLESGHAVALQDKLFGLLEHVVPVACYGANALRARPASRALSVAGALGVLAGGLLMRAAVFHAGNRSASRPQDYLALTQPDAPHTLQSTPKPSH